MTIDGDRDLKALRKIGKIVARCLKVMGSRVEAGITTLELDEIGAKILEGEGARSAPITSYDFPATTCISVNEEVAHGIASDRRLQDGDMVHIDVSAELDGYYGDTGASFLVGKGTDEQRRLVKATQLALKKSLERARAGAPLRSLGAAIEQVAKSTGFGVIRNLGSHGIGRSLHEEPKFVPGFDDPRETRTIEQGAVMTLEPFLTTGRENAVTQADGWTLTNTPGSWTAQFEHTFVVTKKRPILLTLA